MNSNIKVSIIVPAYNVDKYIEKCIRSILNQTYTNIEVIVVNDGSTDSTRDILLKYQNIYDNFILINTKNGGVSKARNIGISRATGDFITFIDADDYIADDFIEYMLLIQEKTGADFCVSLNCFSKDNEAQVKTDLIEVYNNQKAVALLLSPRVVVGCWNKLYRKSFILENSLAFSTNLYYGEGLYFITQCANLANRIGIGNKRVYYYRRNNQSSATSTFNINKIINGEKSLHIIKGKIDLNNQLIKDMFALHLSLYSLGAIVNIINHGKKEIYIKEYIHFKKYINEYLFIVLKSKNVSLYRKLLLMSGYLLPSLIARLDALRRRRLVENSIK